MAEHVEYLRVKEAAALLGVSPNTIRAWGEGGKIPEYRHPINRFRLYKRAELEGILGQIEASRAGETTGRPESGTGGEATVEVPGA